MWEVMEDFVSQKSFLRLCNSLGVHLPDSHLEVHRRCGGTRGPRRGEEEIELVNLGSCPR